MNVLFFGDLQMSQFLLQTFVTYTTVTTSTLLRRHVLCKISLYIQNTNGFIVNQDDHIEHQFILKVNNDS